MLDDSRFHCSLERWARFDIYNMLGNISSEVGRAISARRRGEDKQEQGAIGRALELFALTTECLRGTEDAYRLREILRARDQFLALFYDGTFETDADKIDEYFTFYALAARARHYQKQGRKS
jgi:hypothetical protein